MHKNEQHEQHKNAQPQITAAPTAEAGSNAWWEARLAAIAGGRESSHEADDWTKDLGGTTTTEEGITTATLEPG